VAQSLKLGPRQVAALENEDWQSLPGNTMIRGFVRNYARLLNIDVEP
jgi:cytoskeleton protein RodZ